MEKLGRVLVEGTEARKRNEQDELDSIHFHNNHLSLQRDVIGYRHRLIGRHVLDLNLGT